MTDVVVDRSAVPEVTALDALLSVDTSLRRGTALTRCWATGFTPLDTHLGGGLHAGDLALLAGAQGAGKTTAALQAARNVAAAGGEAVVVCYEHSPTQLLERLLVMEAALVAGPPAPSQEEVRLRLAHGGTDLVAALADLPGMAEAMRAVERYGSRLRLVGARGDVTGMPQLRQYATAGGEPALLVVDYLQKVHAGDVVEEDVRVARIATALKDLALEVGCAVLAIAAVDRTGLDSQRIRARHLKGSVTLAYEADVILVLQRKYDVVTRRHLMYDVGAAEEYHRWLVWSLEKNRHGADHVDLEFRARFSHGLVDPRGRIVSEALVSERVHDDGVAST